MRFVETAPSCMSEFVLGHGARKRVGFVGFT